MAKAPREPEPMTPERSLEALLSGVAAVLGCRPETLADKPAGPALQALATNVITNGADRADPVRTTFGLLGDRWSMLLISLLYTGAYHHSALRRLANLYVPDKGISQRILTRNLRALERDGFVQRRMLSTRPRRVEYALTPLGRELGARMNAMIDWIIAESPAIRAARADFDRREAAGETFE